VALGQERVFLDASVFVAAARSPSGGSSLALEVCRGRRFGAVTSRRVLLEAQRNIAAKFGDEELLRFYRQLADLDPEIVEPAAEAEIEQYAHLIERRDAHVLVGAVKSGASFLLTLDRKHFMRPELEGANLPLSILTPGDFLKRLLP
jgi:predicted nucleic acid-binding protein